MEKGTIHRNFMGYSSSSTQLMIGLGVSAISDSWYSFAQNEKSIEAYYEMLEQNQLPVVKGHVLTDEDLKIRKHILNLMCTFRTDYSDSSKQLDCMTEILEELRELEKDNLIKIENQQLYITRKGRPYVRNVCMAFDLRLQRNKPTRQLFSMTI